MKAVKNWLRDKKISLTSKAIELSHTTINIIFFKLCK